MLLTCETMSSSSSLPLQIPAWMCTWLHCPCRANMDVLVSLGTNASYIYSLISIIHHHLAFHHTTGDCRLESPCNTSMVVHVAHTALCSAA